MSDRDPRDIPLAGDVMRAPGLYRVVSADYVRRSVVFDDLDTGARMTLPLPWFRARMANAEVVTTPEEVAGGA